jgi:general secretion pathway protein A
MPRTEKQGTPDAMTSPTLSRYWDRNGPLTQGSRQPVSFIETPPHEEALARLEFLIERRRSFGCLTGPSGTGKSLVLNMAARAARNRGCEVTCVDLFGSDSHDTLWQLAVNSRLDALAGKSHRWLWQSLTDHWNSLASARQQSVLILDHLEHAEPDSLQLIARILHLDAAQSGWLTVLTAASEDLGECLLADLIEHADLRIELPRLNRRETSEFVEKWLMAHDYSWLTLSEDARHALFQLGEGNPRELIGLVQLAIAAADHANLNSLDATAIHDVARERPVRSRPGLTEIPALAASWS